MFAASAALAAGTTVAMAAPAETRIKAIWRAYRDALKAHHALLEGQNINQWTAAAKLSPFREAMDQARFDMEVAPIHCLEDLGLKIMVVTGNPFGANTDLRFQCEAFLEGVA